MEYPPYPPPSDDSNYNFLADIDMDAVTARLKHLAREAHASRIPYTDDGSEHHKLLSRAISNVLSTELARFTLAQIIDGLPTADTAWDSRSPAVFGDHPIEEHPELCPGVMNRARDFIQQFDQSVLRFDAQALHFFQRAFVGSKAFNVRLIELVARAVHDVGVLLFQMKLRMHQGDIDSTEQWNLPQFAHIPPEPCLFYYWYFSFHDIYPSGVADGVGYWAENRILGGVAVFDRLTEERAPEMPPNVFFLTDRHHVTRHCYQLHDDQQQALLDLLLVESPDPQTSPLPILPSDQNRVRIHWQVAIINHVYRDIWEHKPPTLFDMQTEARRPKNLVDWTTSCIWPYIHINNDSPTVTITPPRNIMDLVIRIGGGSAEGGTNTDESAGKGGDDMRQNGQE